MLVLIDRQNNKKTALLGALDIYRFPSLCTAPSPLLRICKDHPMDHPSQASSAKLMLVLKLPVSYYGDGGYGAMEVTSHVCSASGYSKHAFQQKIIRKQVFWWLLTFRCLAAVPSPLLRICKDHPMDHPSQASSAKLMLVLKLSVSYYGEGVMVQWK